MSQTKEEVNVKKLYMAPGVEVGDMYETFIQPAPPSRRHLLGTDSLGSWFNVLPKIKNLSSFITIDLKNHGRSDSSWERWSVDENADIVISIIDELNIDECFLAGWSMGSAVSLTISKKIPEKIKKIIVFIAFYGVYYRIHFGCAFSHFLYVCRIVAVFRLPRAISPHKHNINIT